ncbi:hypothetical protein GF385_02425 [Candidatus Dependentiae bacterium]|nr:hypothetical protein [Candidatus Dependentiae bacterium]
MKLFNAKKLSLLFLCLVPSIVLSVQMYNQYDPMVYHTIYGVNKTYKKQKSKFQVNLNLSPFYQHASGAKDGNGDKVPEGDIFGWWNLFGLFYGVTGTSPNKEIKAAPTSKPFTLDPVVGGDNPDIPDATTRSNYPNLSAAWRVLDNQSEGGATDYDVTNLVLDFTDPTNFNNTVQPLKTYMPKTYIKYEKFGVRGQIDFTFDFGLGLNVKGGLVDYKQVPNFQNRTGYAPSWPPEDSADDYVDKYLRRLDVMEDVLSEVGINIDQRQETTLEDTHAEIYLQFPFDVMNDNNELVVTLVPYLAGGVWIPTGKEKNQDAAFSLPTGNDGFWGVTVDGAINFALPASIQFGFGVGLAYFFERDLDDYRIAANDSQQAIFPWKAKIKKDPGLLWNFNASLKALQFLDNFSAYMDFIYLRHNRDEITMREDDEDRNDYFLPSTNEENSKWWATIFQGGVEYVFSKGLQIGIGFQAHLSGRRVYRTTTILGTMSFVF